MNFLDTILGGKKEKPSKEFKEFLQIYFTGNMVARIRNEEDTSIWQRLTGDELEKAKKKIVDNILTGDPSYIRAADIFRDKRAIKPLEQIAEEGSDIYIRTCAAKVLFDWVGYDKYFDLLDKVYNEEGGRFCKTNLYGWIYRLKEEDALKYFWKAMNDSDSGVRFSAYDALKFYYGIWETHTDVSEIKYFTSEKVYKDKLLFAARLSELETKIKNWRTTKPNNT